MKKPFEETQKILAALLLILATTSGCAKHPQCLKADIFGHCKQWEGHENPCKDPDFLGFCPRG